MKIIEICSESSNEINLPALNNRVVLISHAKCHLTISAIFYLFSINNSTLHMFLHSVNIFQYNS